MIIELISIKPKAISTFMTLEKIIGGQGQRSRPFYGSSKARKGIKCGSWPIFWLRSFTKSPKLESVQKHTGENCLLDLCTTIFQKAMAAIFQDGGHENHFLHSFLQTSAILMILVSNHTFLTMQNLNFELRNLVKAYLTKYETTS